MSEQSEIAKPSQEIEASAESVSTMESSNVEATGDAVDGEARCDENATSAEAAGIDTEELLAKLEEQNRKLLEDARVPLNLPSRVSPSSSVCSLEKSGKPGEDGKVQKDSESSPSPSVHRRSSTSSHTVMNLLSGFLHQKDKDKDKDKDGATIKEDVGGAASKSESVTSTGHVSEPLDEYQVWGEMLANWDDTKKRRSQRLKQLTRQGIPTAVRGLAWQLLAEAKDLPLPESYLDLLQQDSACEKQIRRDIARTFPEHDFFKEKDSLGQEALFNVMKAYSLHDREVGYCQGSPFVVGLLLMQMPEEESFSMLVRLMGAYQLRELFKPSMPELNVCLHQLDFLLQEHLPQLHSHFRAQGLRSTMYASSWFLTLYATTFPLNVTFRIMDCFLLEGMELIFRVGVALLQTCAEELLRSDMETMIKFLQNGIKQRYSDEGAVDSLFTQAFELKINSRRLKKAGKDFKQQREKETEESVENRQLRGENQILMMRINQLEEETQTLAQRLINGQVSRAEEAEEVFILKREKSALKRQVEELSSQMKNMEQEHQAQLAMMNVGLSGAHEGNSAQVEISVLRQRQAEMASSLATAHLRIAELTSENVKCYQNEKLLNEQVTAVNQEVKLLRQQLADRSREPSDSNPAVSQS